MPVLENKPKQPSFIDVVRAVQWAKANYEREGEIEFDTPSTAKEAKTCASAIDSWEDNGGFYVKAWVWVPNER